MGKRQAGGAGRHLGRFGETPSSTGERGALAFPLLPEQEKGIFVIDFGGKVRENGGVTGKSRNDYQVLLGIGEKDFVDVSCAIRGRKSIKMGGQNAVFILL